MKSVGQLLLFKKLKKSRYKTRDRTSFMHTKEANMDLSKISNQELLGRLERLANSERKITHLILWHINEVEARRLFADLGFGSMYDYLTKHLGYGESSAYRRIQSARLLKQVPQLAEKLETGALNLTQLTQVQKCLKQEAKTGKSADSGQTARVLEQIENKSTYETQKILAVKFNQPIEIYETLKPQQDESVRLEITLTQDQMKTLQQAKELLSHVLPDANWAQVISLLAEKHVKKVLGKEPVQSVALDPESPTPRFSAKQERSGIKITTRRRLLQRAHHSCEYTDSKTGKKCQSTYQLQIDHRIPLALGGPHEMENFRVLCRTHNLLAARLAGLGHGFGD
jgi:hypothetical protein